MGYPGGKNGAGVYQKIINLVPPHDVYIETHLGGGAIMKNKRPAKKNIGIDIDPAVIDMWQNEKNLRKDLNIIQGDAARFLKEYAFEGNEFVYCDPPYLMETRKGGQLYLFEYDQQQHVELLGVLLTLPCKAMISGYWSELYSQHLHDWSTISFEAMTRGGSKATEYIWFNYPEPVRLHDYSFLGSNFRERERIKRKKERWVNRLQKMPVLERKALLSVINDLF